MMIKSPLFRSSSLRAKLMLCLCTALSVGLLTGCDLSRNYTKADRSGDMDVQDYRDALAQRLPEAEKDRAGDKGVPDLQPYIASPSASGKSMPLVSVTVNQDVPLRDVLYELAHQAEYDVELDPRIAGSIIFTARNRPLDEVVDRISEIAGLRYKFGDDMMRVELDTPYHETYKINYLAYVRTNESSVSNDISVVSGEGADTGSSFKATSKSEADFWGELESNLTQLIGGTEASTVLTTPTLPVTPVSGEAPPPLQPVVGSIPANIEPAAGEPMTTPPETPARFSLNRQAGIVSVYGPQRLQKRIGTYLSDLKKSVTSQVLIEAKVLEVSLRDEFSAGIDWSTVGLFGGEGLLQLSSVEGGLVRGILDPATGPVTNFKFSQQGNDFTAVIDAVSRFGTVHALASPRLTVLNNQSAVLNVAQNEVYFEIDITTTTNDNVSQTTVDSQIRNVPEGVIINVQPSIDLDDAKISMAVRPTVTRITGFRNDPAVAFASANLPEPIQSQIPVVNVQEFDSVIQMNSGQAIVMGGLIQDRTVSEQNGVPVLGEVPLVGALFRNQQDQIQKTELIVLLKATIVEGGNAVHATDKDLYRGFSQDRRPFDL